MGSFSSSSPGCCSSSYWFPFHFNFTAAHYYGAWVFFAAFLLHAVLKVPMARRALATRGALAQVLRTDLADTRPERSDGAPDTLVPVAPAAPSMSRRALLGAVAGGAAVLAVQGIAQAVGGPIRSLAFMLPRGRTTGTGPNDFPVNGTFAGLGLTPDMIKHWRLTVHGSRGRSLVLTREQLLAMPQYTYTLPISCREGWSTTQRWTGVRIRELAAAVGMPASSMVDLAALDGGTATLSPNQVSAESTLLVLSVNGAPLSLDHGFPARVIVPAEIGDMCLKWIHTMTFGEGEHE